MADRIKKMPLGAKPRLAKSKFSIEDDTHESSIEKGEKFYLSQTKTKAHLYDTSDRNAIFRYELTAKDLKLVTAKSKDLSQPKVNNAKTRLRKAELEVVDLRKELRAARLKLKRYAAQDKPTSSIEREIRVLEAELSDAAKTAGSMNNLSQFGHLNS